MPKNLTLSALFVAVFGLTTYSQSESRLSQLHGTYLLVQKTSDAIEEKLQSIDLQMLDLYRSENADNTVTVEHDGQTITITLLSAAKCRDQGLTFNDELVEKGKLMGTNPDLPASFIFGISDNLRLNDKTIY